MKLFGVMRWLWRRLFPPKKPSPKWVDEQITFVKAYLDAIVGHLLRPACGVLSEDERERLRQKYHQVTITSTMDATSFCVNKQHILVSLLLPCGTPKHDGDVIHEVTHMLCHVINADFSHGIAFWEIKSKVMLEIRQRLPLLFLKRNIASVRLNAAARVIQRRWRYAVSNPNHPVCKRRLLKEAMDLVGQKW